MSNNYFEIIRAGINTTFQDKGRNNLYHIGIPFSGAPLNGIPICYNLFLPLSWKVVFIPALIISK